MKSSLHPKGDDSGTLVGAKTNDGLRARRKSSALSQLSYYNKADTYSETMPRQVFFGWRVDHRLTGNQREKQNLTRTARYTKFNWVPISLMHQLTKLANIYFVVITLLAFVPDSPKAPWNSLLTLFLMLAFLVIKDGQEDKMRRQTDDATNNKPANCYQYGDLGFRQKPQKELRVGDIVTVFNNDEVPADLLLINVQANSAFFDTVNLDGEAILSERYAADGNVNTGDLQLFRGLVGCEDPNPVI